MDVQVLEFGRSWFVATLKCNRRILVDSLWSSGRICCFVVAFVIGIASKLFEGLLSLHSCYKVYVALILAIAVGRVVLVSRSMCGSLWI